MAMANANPLRARASVAISKASDRIVAPKASATQAPNRTGFASQVQFAADANSPRGPEINTAYPGQHDPETQNASKGKHSRYSKRLRPSEP